MPVQRAQATHAGRVSSLRRAMDRVSGPSLGTRVVPVPSALARVLPGGGLREGAVYTLDASTSLLLALLVEPTRRGDWCGVVGMPELGVEAAAQLGVSLSRLALVPEPGPRWRAVTATLADAMPVVAVRAASRTAPAEAARLAARLRERGTVLLVQGEWPQAEAALSLDEPEWSGLGEGWGRLGERTVTVTVRSRRRAAPQRVRVRLPDGCGALRDGGDGAVSEGVRGSEGRRDAVGTTWPVVTAEAAG